MYARADRLGPEQGELLVTAAWWADPLGRRHWYIKTGRSPHDEFDVSVEPTRWRALLLEMDSGHARANEHHPLTYIAPPMSFLWRFQGERREPFVVCRCGFAGTPATLRWMGRSCGPCHDREQEGDPPLGPEPCRSRGAAFVQAALAADGRLVTRVAVGKIGDSQTTFVRMFAPPYTEPAWEFGPSDRWMRAVACSPRHVAVHVADRLLILSLADGLLLDTREGLEPGPLSMAFAGPDAGYLLVAPGPWTRCIAIAPDGKIGGRVWEATSEVCRSCLVAGEGGRRVLISDFSVRDPVTGFIQDRPGIHHGYAVGAVLDLDGVVTASGTTSPFGSEQSRGKATLARWPANDGERDEGHSGRPPRPPTLLTTQQWGGPLSQSADRSVLVATDKGLDGGGFAVFDAATLSEVVRFQYDAEDVNQAAVTPDGETVIALTRHGLAVYPRRELARVR